MDANERTSLSVGDESSEGIRVGNALSSSGLSITLTSLCTVMAFFVGSAVDLPGVSAFCVYAAWSFFANYVLQFLLFVPLMVIDNRRIRQKRNFCCPCFCRHDDEKRAADIVDVKSNTFNETNDAREVPVACSLHSNSTNSINISSALQSTAGGNNLSSEQNDRCLSKTLVSVMTQRPCRWLIIILFLCTVSGSIYVIPSVKTGSDPETYVPDDSMVLQFVDTLDTVWSGSKIVEQDIVIKNQDFSDIAVRENVYELMTNLESQEDALDAVTNWLDEFEFFLNETGQDMDTMDSSQFYSELQSFSNGTRWESEIIYDDPLNPTQIEFSRFKLSVNGANRYHNAWPQYLAWNEVFDQYFPSNTKGFILHRDALFGYFSNTVLSLAANNMIFAVIGVFGVLIIFVDLKMALFLLVIVSMIDVHLMAWIWMFGITLDPTAYIECVMAVGLTVDYVIHITHSIAEAQPEIYGAKLRIAMNTIGVSVWFVPSDIHCQVQS